MLVARFEAFAQVQKFVNVLEFINSQTYGWRVIYNNIMIVATLVGGGSSTMP